MLRGWSMADVQMGLTWGIICDSVVEDGANISWKCRRRNCTSEVEEVTVVGYALSRGTEVQFCLLSSLFSFSLLRDIRLVDSRQAFLYFGETVGLFNFFNTFCWFFKRFKKNKQLLLFFTSIKLFWLLFDWPCQQCHGPRYSKVQAAYLNRFKTSG